MIHARKHLFFSRIPILSAPGFLVSFAAVLMLAGNAFGETVCEYYRREAPSLYKLMCSSGSASTKPAGANSSFSDSFNLNTAALPTEPSSMGIETLGNYLRTVPFTWSPTFSLIKGFHRFGTGISTSGNNTFFGNDVIQRAYGTPNVDSFEPHETAKGAGVNLNLGTSIALYDVRNGPSFKLGLSARYNKITDSLGGGPGLMVSYKNFTLGAGYTRERVSNFLPRITFTNFMASVRLALFEFEYTRLKNLEGIDLGPVEIFSTTATVRRLTLTAALRKSDYLLYGTVVQSHFAIQYLFSKTFSAGFLYNYIPGASTVGTQIYL